MEILRRKRMNGAAGDYPGGPERGSVLIVVIVLSAVALMVATSLLYMITMGTKLSGMEKRYRTARDASYGAVEVLGQMIFSMQTTTTGETFLASWNYYKPPAIDTCTGVSGASSATGLRAKIMTPSSSWNANCNKSSVIDPNTPATYDFSFEIGTNPVYKVYAKIIDTVPGNTMGSYAGSEVGSGIDTHQGTTSTRAELPVEQVPFSYLLEIDTRNKTNASEKSRLSVFYQY